jgi:hypothetical protein
LVLVPGAEPLPERLEMNKSLGLTAALAPVAAAELSLSRDVLPTLDLWRHQPDSDQLHRLVSSRTAGTWSALVHLDPDAGRWLLAAPGSARVALMSDQRLPGWWQFPEAERERVLVLTAEPGDVVLLGGPFPTGAEFSAAALSQAALGGASALADHLAAAAKAAGTGLAAIALEVSR